MRGVDHSRGLKGESGEVISSCLRRSTFSRDCRAWSWRRLPDSSKAAGVIRMAGVLAVGERAGEPAACCSGDDVDDSLVNPVGERRRCAAGPGDISSEGVRSPRGAGAGEVTGEAVSRGDDSGPSAPLGSDWGRPATTPLDEDGRPACTSFELSIR